MNYDASLQKINWNPTPANDNIDPPMTRLMKKKSSTFSVRDIPHDPQRGHDDDDIVGRGSLNLSQLNLNNLSNIYNLNNDANDNFDINLDGLFPGSQNTKTLKPTARKPNVSFGKSLSGFSNISNSNDFGNNKSSLMQQDNQNLFKTLQNSLNFVKIPVSDFVNYDLDDNYNVPEIPNISSRGNSFRDLLKSDTTPALFRGGSSIIDPRLLKRK